MGGGGRHAAGPEATLYIAYVLDLSHLNGMGIDGLKGA
jgi:hypothetical protein